METRSNAQLFFGRCVLATFGGWVLGFVAIVLLVGVGNLVHIGGDEWTLGVGMGWSIGCTQWWVARRGFVPSSEWMGASVVGMGTPFVPSEIPCEIA